MALEDIATYFPVIILLLFGYKFKQNKSVTGYKIYFAYLVHIVLVSVSSGILFNFGVNNLFISHIYFIGESLLLSLFFRQLLIKSQRKNADVLIITIFSLISILVVLDTLGYYVIEAFDPIEIILCALPILILAITHLYNCLSEPLKYIYVTIGIVLYKTISVLVFILQNFANADKFVYDFSYILLKLNSVFSLIYYGLILVEWYKNYRHKRID